MFFCQSVDWIFYFLYGTHCLMHTWACYNLCSRRWQWKCVFIIAVLFFCLCLTFLAYQYKYVCVHGLNAATSQDVLLGLRPVIRRLNLLRISSFLFFFCRPERWCAAGSRQLQAWMLVCYRTRGNFQITPSNNPTVVFNHLSSYLLLKCLPAYTYDTCNLYLIRKNAYT